MGFDACPGSGEFACGGNGSYAGCFLYPFGHNVLNIILSQSDIKNANFQPTGLLINLLS
jgi:hypothetical protein